MNESFPTILHRILRVSPGNLPRWIVSKNACDGIDALVFVDALGVIGIIFLLFEEPLYAIPAAIAFGLYLRRVRCPVESVERRARRDSRRNRTRHDVIPAADSQD